MEQQIGKFELIVPKSDNALLQEVLVRLNALEALQKQLLADLERIEEKLDSIDERLVDMDRVEMVRNYD